MTTLLQFDGTVVNANAIISFAARTSHNLNSTLNFSSAYVTLPVIKAGAFNVNLKSRFQVRNIRFL